MQEQFEHYKRKWDIDLTRPDVYIDVDIDLTTVATPVAMPVPTIVIHQAEHYYYEPSVELRDPRRFPPLSPVLTSDDDEVVEPTQDILYERQQRNLAELKRYFTRVCNKDHDY